jgi:hypothetical protein
MAYLPVLAEAGTSRLMTEVFTGYDHNLKIADGSWYEEKNLSSVSFPLFSPRQRRGQMMQLVNPQGILSKDALAYVDGSTLYYNHLPVDGITLSTRKEDCPKQMVSMGAYLCIFPDGVYVNTQDLTDAGALAAKYELNEGTISLKLCRNDGTDYDISDAVLSDTEPSEPADQAFWIDTSTTPHTLKQFSAASSIWVQVATTYIKISAAGIGEKFDQYDGVHIQGLAYSDDNDAIEAQVNKLNTTNIIEAKGDDYIIITGIIDMAVAWEGDLVVERRVPKMNFVCELDNRLWGCFYGMHDGKVLNEIYASALGNPKVWNRYRGVSTDSYTASVGSDGIFTGMTSYLGYVLAFKENCIHKVYGTMPSNFQITTTNCRGVQKGSEYSLCAVNEKLFYKSKNDICMYDGSLPNTISDAFASQTFSEARAGAYGSRYVVSMKDAKGKWGMYTFDTDKGIWHCEDDVHALMFATLDDDLVYIDADTKWLMSEGGKHGTLEGPVEWEATSGIIGYEYPDQKYLSRFNLRMRMNEGDVCEILVRYDSEGEWFSEGVIRGVNTQSFTIPVIPRRCDHMQIRLRGRGDVKIYSIAKILEVGSDV